MLDIYYARKRDNYTGSKKVRTYKEALTEVAALLILGMTNIVVYNSNEIVFDFNEIS